jgi:2-amino-4-hydroxy-6-hydroxymethyldihydropteridine diphosphokinase
MPAEAMSAGAGPAEAGPAEAGPAGAVKRRAFVALGSNLGDRLGYLRGGARRLPDVVAVSAVYETVPVGGPADQGLYLNMVAELCTAASPRQLLGAARRAERWAGRARSERWGPRTLDVDVLLVGELQVRTAELQVPHPRMWERGFVLVPLGDLAPELVSGRLSPAMVAGVRRWGRLEVPPGERGAERSRR